MILIMKEIRTITGSIFYFRDSAGINGSGSFQTSCRFDKGSASKSATKTYRCPLACIERTIKEHMKTILTFFLLITSVIVNGQEIKTTSFTEEIKKYDISDLWTLDQFQIENDTITVDRPEPLGYIGENFQRFQIHFISAIKNAENELQYFIYGKTKVKENICTFQGTININESRIYDEGDIPTLKQGFVKGQYEFFEDPDQKGAGILKGNFQTNFYINEKGEIKYDALMFVADGFENNQFEGTWTRWHNYIQAWGHDPDKPEVIEAREKEKEKWWL
ncbi:MAG: hypothetical protein PWP68_122 [Rikenellaceae bacterium]|nr:hypothetical protein [Rikenellaceae bacterium]